MLVVFLGIGVLTANIQHRVMQDELETITEQGVLQIGVFRDVSNMLWHSLLLLLTLLLTRKTTPDTGDAQHAVGPQLCYRDDLPWVSANMGTAMKVAERLRQMRARTHVLKYPTTTRVTS